MAVVRIPEENRSLSEIPAIVSYLSGRGIEYERWTPNAHVADGGAAAGRSSGAPDKIDALAQGGYVTAGP
jgi:hypothetical protein